jgi:hypothetical protein
MRRRFVASAWIGCGLATCLERFARDGDGGTQNLIRVLGYLQRRLRRWQLISLSSHHRWCGQTPQPGTCQVLSPLPQSLSPSLLPSLPPSLHLFLSLSLSLSLDLSLSLSLSLFLSFSLYLSFSLSPLPVPHFLTSYLSLPLLLPLQLFRSISPSLSPLPPHTHCEGFRAFSCACKHSSACAHHDLAADTGDYCCRIL